MAGPQHIAPRPICVAGGDGLPAGNRLAQGRLAVALDALLNRRNVTLAAQDLGLHTAALSRLLAQLREILGDPLFVRSGRGLVPTPFAEALRPKVRAAAMALDAIFGTAGTPAAEAEAAWTAPEDDGAPPLAVADGIQAETEPQGRLARHIGVLGMTGGKSRPLTMEEAEDALAIILAGDADPVQVGALVGMTRMRGTTAPELAGFVQAARAHVAGRLGRTIRADVDWPCYGAPNYHNPPWFFHAAHLVARAGHRVVLHGHAGGGGSTVGNGAIARALGIPVCATAKEIAAALRRGNIAYVPLAALAPQLYRLIHLQRLLESRSAMAETVHLLKPVEGGTSLLGVARPSYKTLHRDTARLLGWKHLAVVENARDVAQFTPFRLTVLQRLVNGEPDAMAVPALLREPPATPRPRGTSMEYWQGVWTGAIRDARAEQVIVSTAAFALSAIPKGRATGFSEAMQHAWELWRSRQAGTSKFATDYY